MFYNEPINYCYGGAYGTTVRNVFMCLPDHEFYRAAEQLNLTQPAVSQHIRFLEKQYGMPLFIHDGRRLRLTPAGKVLRSAVSVMRNDEAEVRRRMQTAEAPSQQLFFGVTMTIGEYAVTQPLAAYCKRHPEKISKWFWQHQGTAGAAGTGPAGLCPGGGILSRQPI